MFVVVSVALLDRRIGGIYLRLKCTDVDVAVDGAYSEDPILSLSSSTYIGLSEAGERAHDILPVITIFSTFHTQPHRPGHGVDMLTPVNTIPRFALVT